MKYTIGFLLGEASAFTIVSHDASLVYALALLTLAWVFGKIFTSHQEAKDVGAG